MARDDQSDNELEGAAARAARVLRDDVPMRAEWRDGVLERVARNERFGGPADRSFATYTMPRRGWTISPPLAIAAGIALVMLGALATRFYDGRRSPTPTSVAAAAATPVVRFVLVAPKAGAVTVVGDFNHWDPAAAPLHRLGDGQTWIIDVPLTPGRYAYGFMVDGKLQADPTAPRAGGDDFGVVNSVLMVRGS